MILLDTNVISDSMRIQPDGRVLHWLDRHPASTLFISTVTVDEISFGIEVLPAGRKKSRLVSVFSRVLDVFSGRVVSFDAKAAVESAKFQGQRRVQGTPMSLADSQIAGIAKSKGFALATLNVQDFRGIDLVVVDPR